MSDQTTEASPSEAPNVSQVINNENVRKMSMSSAAFEAAVTGKNPVNSVNQETSSSADEGDSDSETQNSTGDDQSTSREDKKPNGLQRRFNKLTEARDRAESRAAELEARIAALEGRGTSAQVEAIKETAAPAREVAQASGEFVFDKPEPDPDAFDRVSEYIKAQAKWEAAKSIAETRWQGQVQEQQKAFKEQFNNLQNKGREIEQRLGLQKGEFDLYIRDPEFKMSEPAKALILKSDVGAEVAFEIASNEDLRARVAKMTPAEQLHLIGKLEGKYESTGDAPKGGNRKTNAKPIGKDVRGDGNKPASVTKKPLNSLTTQFKSQAEFYEAVGRK
jgi:hypothetical protein